MATSEEQQNPAGEPAPADDPLFDLGDGGAAPAPAQHDDSSSAEASPAADAAVGTEHKKPGRPKKAAAAATDQAGDKPAGKKRGPYRKRLAAGAVDVHKGKRKRPGEELLRRERLQLVAAVEAMQRAREKNEMLMSEADDAPSVMLAYTTLVTDLLAEFHKGVLAEFDRKFARYTVGGAGAGGQGPAPKKD